MVTNADSDVLVDAIARRVVELLSASHAAVGLVDAATVAAHLGVARGWVYRHADALGAVRLGNGRRARMRFDLERALHAAAALAGPPEPASGSKGSRRAPSPRPPVPVTDVEPLRARRRW